MGMTDAYDMCWIVEAWWFKNAMGDGEGRILRGAEAEFHIELEGSVGLVSALILMVQSEIKVRRDLAVSENWEVENDENLLAQHSRLRSPEREKILLHASEQSKLSRFATTTKAFRLSPFIEIMRKHVMIYLQRFPLIQGVTCRVTVLSDKKFLWHCRNVGSHQVGRYSAMASSGQGDGLKAADPQFSLAHITAPLCWIERRNWTWAPTSSAVSHDLPLQSWFFPNVPQIN